jgi:hypothetical protein
VPNGAPDHPSVLVASTGKNAEDPTPIPIERSPGSRHVVLSFGPAERAWAGMPALIARDRIEVSGELEVTTDAPTPGPAVVGKPYRYDPRVEVDLLLAGDAKAAAPEPGRAIRIGRRRRLVCDQRQHHRVITFDPGSHRYSVPQRGLPWRGPSYLNVVLAAFHPDATSGQVLLIGQNEPAQGGVPAHSKGDMAKLNVVRFRGAPPPRGKRARTKALQARAVPVANEERTVVRSLGLDGLEGGEQLVLTAQLHTSNPHQYAARISTRVILADSPTATELGGRAKEVAGFDGELAKFNGSNCLPGRTYVTRKYGATRILRAPGKPLHVNHVATSADPEGTPGRGDALAVKPAGFLQVVRYGP